MNVFTGRVACRRFSRCTAHMAAVRRRHALLLPHCGGSRRGTLRRAQQMQSVGVPHGLPPSAAVSCWLAVAMRMHKACMAHLPACAAAGRVSHVLQHCELVICCAVDCSSSGKQEAGHLHFGTCCRSLAAHRTKAALKITPCYDNAVCCLLLPAGTCTCLTRPSTRAARTCSSWQQTNCECCAAVADWGCERGSAACARMAFNQL
jgi:hypothetical protein